MKRWQKLLLGLGSHWFFIYLPVFMVVIFTFVFTMPKGQDMPAAFPVALLLLILVHFASIVFMLGTIGFLIAYVVKQPRFTSNDRLLWVLLLAFAGAIAAPVFFWLHIRPHPLGEPFFGNPA